MYYDPEESAEYERQRIAVENSWKIEYKGESANLFRKILHEYQTKDLQRGESFYARYTTVIQSSGTGKSRMVDEAGRKLIHIPINLSSARPFPPGDHDTRYWFIQLHHTQRDYCSEALLSGFFQQTRICLQDLESRLSSKLPADDEESTRKRLQVLASMLHDHLAEGMSFKTHGGNRRAFHAAAIDFAKQHLAKYQYSVHSSADALQEFIDPKKQLPASEPTVLLSFDEAHNLFDTDASSLFLDLCRTLHGIKRVPFWTIFISTSPRFPLVAPHSYYKLFPPITETGFDDFAEPMTSGDPRWTLARIASTHHIAHLGRDMFPTRYDEGSYTVREDIVGFAKTKVTCYSQGTHPSSPPHDSQLACLAIRLALAFEPESSVQRRLVEKHMRIILSFGEGERDLVTVSPSEPLLAEGAYRVMAFNRKWSPETALRYHVLWSGIKVGERGECAVALVLLLARDAAVRSGSRRWRDNLEDDGLNRVTTVTGFLEALLATDKERLVSQPPAFYRNNSEALGEAFKHGRIWFNHFVRVDDYDMINQELLWRLVGRGAAIICETNQRAVDILIPVLIGDVLAKENVTAIFIQIKNDKSYTEEHAKWFFEAMNPFRVGLFSKGVDPLPVIRMVFSLASEEPAVDYLQLGANDLPPGVKTTYTAYDIWCAGISHKTFSVIKQDMDSTYRDILDSAVDPYTSTHCPLKFEKERGDMRRAMRPGVSVLKAHQRLYEDVDLGSERVVGVDV